MKLINARRTSFFITFIKESSHLDSNILDKKISVTFISEDLFLVKLQATSPEGKAPQSRRYFPRLKSRNRAESNLLVSYFPRLKSRNRDESKVLVQP